MLLWGGGQRSIRNVVFSLELVIKLPRVSPVKRRDTFHNPIVETVLKCWNRLSVLRSTFSI
jgi:hypothetical protein